MSNVIEKNVNLNYIRCNYCTHLKDEGCTAFKIIPKEILSGLNNHSKPLKGQGNKVVYEPTDYGKKIKNKIEKSHQLALKLKKAGL